MDCPKCGYRNPDWIHTCGSCGSALEPRDTIISLPSSPPSDVLPLSAGTTCFVCGQGKKRHANGLLRRNQFFRCEHCRVEYHPAGEFSDHLERFALHNIKERADRWDMYDNQPLSVLEFQRIANGGRSDAVIEAEERARRLAREQEEERERAETIKRETPGTPENYLYRLKSIVGMTDEERQARFSARLSSLADARSEKKRITQMQKELRQLKREVNASLKGIRSDARNERDNISMSNWDKWWGYSPEMMARRRAEQREDIRARAESRSAPFELIPPLIDQAIVALDGLKVRIDEVMSTAGEREEEPPKILLSH